MLESYDAQFFAMRGETAPGVRLSSFGQPPAAERGARKGKKKKKKRKKTVVPASSHALAPLHQMPPSPGTTGYGAMPDGWQDADGSGPVVPVNAPPPPKMQLSRTHLVVIAAATIVMGVVVVIATANQPSYGPTDIRTNMWHEYHTERPEGYRPGLMDGTGANRQITVTSNPPGARVYAGIKRLGATPVQIDRPRAKQQLLLRVSKPGFNDQTLVVTRTSPALLTVLLSRGLGSPKPTAVPGELDELGLPTYRPQTPGAPPPPPTGVEFGDPFKRERERYQSETGRRRRDD